MKRKRIVACYCRISKSDRKKQKRTGTSPERLLNRFVKTIWVKPVFFVDNEITQQEELQKLRNAIENGKVRAVIVPSITHVLSKGARSTRDMSSVLRFFDEHKVNLVCLKEGLETSSRFLGLFRCFSLIRKLMKTENLIKRQEGRVSATRSEN